MSGKVEITPELTQQVLSYIRQNGSITNRQCRAMLSLSYAQCTILFAHFVETGVVQRVGKNKGTKYILPE
jgi:predicted HTH transcriptional regulator